MRYTLWRDLSGNISLLTALMLIPIMAACGLAVDYAQLSLLRSDLQNANDAAAFMAARKYEETGKLPAKAELVSLLNANLGRPASIVDLAVENGNVVLSSSAQTSLFLGSLLRSDNGTVGVLSAVDVQGDDKLDVVLVLDNTYSMVAEGKIDALKDAARDFVHTLLALNTNGRENVKIAIVPFSNYVNVGMGNRYASWIWVPEDDSGSTPTAAGSYSQCNGWTTDYSDCHTSTSYRDGVATGTYQSCKRTCTGGYTQVSYPAGTRSWSVTWHGCVGSRGPYPENVKDDHPNRPFIGLPATQGLGFPNVSCPTPITPLTADEGLLDEQIDAMIATGETYVAPGVMWGLRVLSEETPYTETADPSNAGAKHQKIMVLMTDGDNTKSPQVQTMLTLPPEIAAYTGFSQLPNPYNEGRDRTLADRMTQEACQAVKDAEITRYSISFGSEVSASGKALMQGCADDDKFYDASHVAEISSTFQKIAAGITAMRLTQ